MFRQESDVLRRKTRERIVHAAKHLFAQRGFAATTTRDIARQAKVNEALLYYYFGRKESLYWAVLEQTRLDSHFVESLRKKLQAVENGEMSLTVLVEFMIRRQENDDTMLRLLLFTGLQEGKIFTRLSTRFYKTHLRRSYELVAEHVRKQIRAKKFRNVDPILASRALFSLVAYHHIIHEFLGGKHVRKYSPKQVAQTVTDLWLRGLRVNGNGRGAR